MLTAINFCSFVNGSLPAIFLLLSPLILVFVANKKFVDIFQFWLK
jgi:hypothetical protein